MKDSSDIGLWVSSDGLWLDKCKICSLTINIDILLCWLITLEKKKNSIYIQLKKWGIFWYSVLPPPLTPTPQQISCKVLNILQLTEDHPSNSSQSAVYRSIRRLALHQAKWEKLYPPISDKRIINVSESPTQSQHFWNLTARQG